MQRLDLFWLYVNNIEKINIAYYSELYFKYKTIEAFTDALKNNKIKIPEKYKAEILSDNWITGCNKILEYMNENNIHVCFYHSSNYPRNFKNIDFPPPILYYIGDFSICEEICIAIVGSRKASSYGKKCTVRFAEAFAKNGIAVVSGMADGIDSYAHWCSLENDGPTIAFLAGGVDYIYPPSNRELYSKLCDKGVVISEFPLKLRPQKPYFPYRNRLISGLSESVVVIESGYPSGTMSTVNYALDQGKDVYAVPGSVSSELSEGTNYLIRSGCCSAVDPYDILSEYNIFRKDGSEGIIPYDDSLEQDHIEIMKRLSVEDLTFEQLEDELMIDPDQLNVLLTTLEILGYIEKLAGRAYTLINKKAE